MVISVIEIKKFENSNSKLKGLATISLDDRFIVQNIRILEHDGNRFLGMPSRKNKEGVFVNVVHPTTSEFEKMMEDVIFAAYDNYEITTTSIQAVA